MTNPAIEVARRIAERAHDGQVDKAGAPYIEHPAMAADLV
jgi:(p)ppGpp synthase/HD superfamily hydrolase